MGVKPGRKQQILHTVWFFNDEYIDSELELF